MAGNWIDPVGCVKEIGKCILTQCIQPPVKRHIDYWWCFDNNIKDLRDGGRDLESKTFDINKKIEEAGIRTEVLRPWVEGWLKDASQKLAEVNTILQDDNIPKAWWNITSRYSIGKMAKEKAEEIAELQKNRNFDTISDPAPPPAERFKCHSSTQDFESRKHIEEDIIEYLRSSSVRMIGICGMGGVGKTTMAKRIVDGVKKELFDEVVMVTVSKQTDSQVQEEIAKSLKLKFDDGDMPADKLRRRLMDQKRKIIIFDDVWESLNFEHLGIPFESDSERCKVLLTSRSKDTFKGIQNKKVFELDILKEDEAWNLFKEKAGECVEDSTLRTVAKDVAAECKGLPIALVTVGTALQDETNKCIWDDSLSQLRDANPTDIEKVLARVYKPMKLSYEYLTNNNQKDLFLLCCLFPEDYDIPVEQLAFYTMGLGLFKGISSIEAARNRTNTLVQKLKSRFLLIDGCDKLHVRMHDVVRDVAIYIGSSEKKGFLKSLNKTSIENSSDAECHWMSVDISNERMESPEASRFSNLRLLMLLKSSYDKFSNIYFEGMEHLNVLSFGVGSLPPTLVLLKNLQTLCLFESQVENISVIGELTSLEILSCNECYNITELPAEIGRLNRLRLLELNECSNLRIIPFGIASSLVLLEELKMRRSFDGWGAEENGKETKNASLTELESLRNLTCLEIKISDSNLAAQQISLPQKLVKYRIHIGCEDYWYEEKESNWLTEKVMKLNFLSDIGSVGKWIQILVKNTEWLYLEGDGSNNINLEECQHLRYLEYRDCSKVKKLVETKDCKSGIVFPLLETLKLYNLENLEEICGGTIILNQNVSLFCNLKSLEISYCSNLKYLFSVSVARRCISQFEVLVIQGCDAMEQVFKNEIRDGITDGCIEFPKLKKLALEYLPNLTAFYEGVETIQFPQLTEMVINGLTMLNSICPLNSETAHDDRTPFNLRTLFSLSMARASLLQLEVLEINRCEAMEHVFWNEIRDGCIEFPKLKKLALQYLPNLKSFCQGLENIRFPQLSELEIGELPKMKNSLCPLNSETPNHDRNSIHFLCNPKVEMGGLKALSLNYLGDYIKNIWCHQIPINFFKNLEKLKICGNDGISNLMPYSVAKNLVSLKFLSIWNCKEMVEVIESDDKEVVDINCLFPTLKQLHIRYLEKLRRFWQWNHTLELPLLEDVNISDCPVIETFTMGSLNTPNIEWISINDDHIRDQKDLNQVIRQHRTLRQDREGSMDEDEELTRDGNAEENKDNNNAMHHFTILNQDGDEDATRTKLG